MKLIWPKCLKWFKTSFFCVRIILFEIVPTEFREEPKKMQTYKPDSVFAKANPYHLSRLTITCKLKLSTLQQRTRSP